MKERKRNLQGNKEKAHVHERERRMERAHSLAVFKQVMNKANMVDPTHSITVGSPDLEEFRETETPVCQ
ncbi:hypothetical protein Q8A67_022437 [Cirrhinus molitorella]|uniref:Uncharacterized protein n=1 Tax=Cirrhinus molitorella TaxID=172907 RepID=A0AA88TLW5_9TELE|nr:hypothetical protein Q8A67_022437 [Cirrhinus molitorella]